MNKPLIAFVCTHNSCRSQMAEALSRHLAGGTWISVSAGTHPAGAIDKDACRILKDHYSIDMIAEGQYSKALTDLPGHIDGVVTMGCGVQCPYVPAAWREDWNLPDPTGKPEADYLAVIDAIVRHISVLKKKYNQT